MRGARGFIVWAACLSFALNARAQADEEGGVGASTAPVHLRSVTIVASEREGQIVSALMKASLETRLGEVQVLLVDPNEASEHQAGEEEVRVALDTRSSETWRLTLFYRDRVWVRSVEGPQKNAAAEEATALIASEATAAIFESEKDEVVPLVDWQEEISAHEAQVVPAPPSKEVLPTKDLKPSRSEVSRLQLLLLASYRTELYAAGTFFHGAHLGVELQSERAWFVGAGVTWGPSLQVESEQGSFGLVRVPIELEAGTCFSSGPYQLCPALGVTMTWSRRGTTVSEAGVGVEEAQAHDSWDIFGRARVARAIAGSVFLYAGAGVQVALTRVELVAAGSDEALLSPYQVRPMLDFGVYFPFYSFGSDRKLN